MLELAHARAWLAEGGPAYAREVLERAVGTERAEQILALKAAPEAVAQRLFAGLSERARTMLRHELEYLGPVRLRDAEDAQSRIVQVARALEEAGEIVIRNGSDPGEALV